MLVIKKDPYYTEMTHQDNTMVIITRSQYQSLFCLYQQDAAAVKGTKAYRKSLLCCLEISENFTALWFFYHIILLVVFCQTVKPLFVFTDVKFLFSLIFFPPLGLNVTDR